MIWMFCVLCVCARHHVCEGGDGVEVSVHGGGWLVVDMVLVV